ncbi:MAG TPA: C45 family peptidase [Casimicrobiaceae bacterium]|nr:C45 family peptidase [Casimicrobiaceae bacterium]
MPRLSYLTISGSPHEAGQALGRFGADAVHRHLLASRDWASVMQWRGSAQARAMASLVRERFPCVWAELEGLAAGLGLPFDDVFLWNARGDVGAMVPEGCTTVQLPGADARRIVHNEDGDPGFGDHCAIAECAIGGSPRFAGFIYPGSLPGHTFAVSDGGLAMTVNNLRLLHVEPGVPRMVLTRALLDVTGLPAALALLRDAPHAGGFHVTLAHRASGELASVEFGAGFCSVHTVGAPSLHANHAIHPEARDRPQIITGSSEHRQLRGNRLLADAAAAAPEPLVILADRGDSKFPIHRDDPADSDGENTLATADITIRAERIDWKVHEHPDSAPRFLMTDGHSRSLHTPERR